MDLEQMLIDADKISEEIQKTAEKNAEIKPVMSLQTFELVVVILLAIIALCLVIITVHIKIKSKGINLNLTRFQRNAGKRSQDSGLNSIVDHAAGKIADFKRLRNHGAIPPQQLQSMQQSKCAAPESARQMADDKVSPLIIFIPIIAVILAFLGGIHWIRSAKENSSSAEMSTQQNSVKVTEQSKRNVETAPQATEISTEQAAFESMKAVSEEQLAMTDAIIQEETTVQKPAEKNVNPAAELRSIAENYGEEMCTGYYSDINGDGIEDLILRNASNRNYHLYSYDASGELKEFYFGYYSAMIAAELYYVPTHGAQYYMYWRCNYQFQSTQGYYDPLTNSEIDIGIKYDYESMKNAEWKLWFNNNEYASGSETVSDTYGATPQCYQKLLAMFQEYGFQINDDSKYEKLECLDKEALLNIIN